MAIIRLLANSRSRTSHGVLGWFNERVQGGSAYVAFSSRNIHIHVDPQEHSEHLLSKEWLVKIDNEKSVPYLMVRPSFMMGLWDARRLWTSPSRSYTQVFRINHASS